MKLMINISDSTYEAIMARDWKNAGWLFSEEMKAIHDGTPIPGGATNGDMIKALFPNLGINSPLKCNDTNWWNAPYKGGQEPCPNAISRSDMLDAIGHGTTYTSEELQIIIKGLPSVNPQPCEDTISRQAAIDAIYKMHMNGKEGVLHELKTETGSDAFFAETIADAVEALEELPPVNPHPKTGYWFAWKPEDDVWRTTCSECGEETRTLWDYCTNCGTKMVEPQESEESE